MKYIKDTEYAYASSLVRSLGEKGTAAERLNSISECRSTQELHRAAADMFRMENFSGDTEQLLNTALENAALLVKESVPDPDLYASLFYKYDCCNIKTCIKCKIRNISPEGMLFKCGTIEPDIIIKSIDEHDVTMLPESMGSGVSEARSAFSSGDKSAIDFIIDKACFDDMSRSAKDSAVDFLIKNVRIRADITNFLSLMRISEMKLPAAAASLMRRSFVVGGSFGIEALVSSDDTLVPADIAASAAENPLLASAVHDAVKTGNGAGTAEKLLDEAYLSGISGVKYIPFGPEVPAAFFIMRETEVKNCRLAAAKLSSRSESAITERIRESYV